MERILFICKFKCEPFLSKYGIYHMILLGEGKLGTRDTYYDISNFIDANRPSYYSWKIKHLINLFDRAIDFLKVGLLKESE